MSAANSEQLHRSTLRIYGNLMEQFNPGLQKLASLGRSYVEAFQALTVTSEAYFSALAKMGEQALHSMSSRSLGDVIIQISECQRRLTSELEGVFCWFHAEVVQEMGANVKLDTDYISGSRRRYEMEVRSRQRRGPGGYKDTLDSLEHFLRQSQREALKEEERRYRFLAEKHCGLTQSLLHLLNKMGGAMQQRAEGWRERVSETRGVSRARTPALPEQDALPRPPPAGPFLQTGREEERHWAGREGQPPERAPSRGSTPILARHSRSSSVGEALSAAGFKQVRALVPHPASANPTLLPFSRGDTLTVLVPQAHNGWLYGRAEGSARQGWFPAAYVGPLAESTGESGCSTTLRSSHSVGDLLDQPDDTLRPAGQQNGVPPPAPPLPRPTSTGLAEQRPTTPTPARRVEADTDNKRSKDQGPRPELFPRGTNPFATVKLRPTATNDRSAPRIP
ncbi:BAR/IMD domain-containing adapter protein 2-like 2 [Lepisosteus oculatus]|uniref:BAR/IMD domain-containing adapter protein 2-like 2 n=1 Tax=Lepisosteus oculatus TaxID=7918 RepID=UPI0035F5062C